MPLKTPEEKKNAIKWVVSQLKVYGLTVLAAFGTVWGVAEIYLEDYVRSTAIEVIEEKNGNKSFREILGEEMDIPTDMVPYYLTAKLTELDSIISHLDKFETQYLPIIEFQQGIIPLWEYIDRETGQQFKSMPDDRAHPVMYDESGVKWIVYGNRRLDL